MTLVSDERRVAWHDFKREEDAEEAAYIEGTRNGAGKMAELGRKNLLTPPQVLQELTTLEQGLGILRGRPQDGVAVRRALGTCVGTILGIVDFGLNGAHGEELGSSLAQIAQQVGKVRAAMDALERINYFHTQRYVLGKIDAFTGPKRGVAQMIAESFARANA